MYRRGIADRDGGSLAVRIEDGLLCGSRSFRAPRSISIRKALHSTCPNSCTIRQRRLEKMNRRPTIQTLRNPEKYAPLLAIRNGREYDAAVAQLNELVDDIGDN